ncbi:MAG: hypothetical protein EPN97_06135 [Alphaproteobacteria bacterium]|nr:MAG: hypothetical protein EPN97_06135 [Alphaproteobacteria bacterium]
MKDADFRENWDDLPRTMVKYEADSTSYYRENVRHRPDGPAIEFKNGDREWWIMGERHRTNGPAVECTDGYKAWYIRDQLHREDGPAVENPDGSYNWYLHGRKLPPEEWGPVQRRWAQQHGEGEAAAAEVEKGLQRDIRPMRPLRFRP